MARDMEKRVADLEKLLDRFVKHSEKLSQRTHDEIIRRMQDQNKVNQKAYDHITKMEKRFDVNLKDQNKVNQKAYDHVAKLEKRFSKFEKLKR